MWGTTTASSSFLQALRKKIADGALAKEAEDEWVAEKINNGEALDGLFPMNKQWRARYEAEQSEA